jgi:FSR family fosmidomycin resistance protein-like MFS transporter
MGYAADRIRGKLPVFLGLCIAAISMSLIGLSRSYGILFILVLLGQIGQSFFHPAGANIASEAGKVNRDRSFAIFSFTGTIGYSLSQPIFSGFTGRFGTQASPFLAIPTVLYALIYLWTSRMEVHGTGESVKLKDLRQILLKRAGPLLLLFFIMMFRSAFVLSLATFLAKTYEQWGFSRAVYSSVVPVFLIAGAFGILVCGHLTHVIKPRILLALTQIAFAPFFLFFLLYGKSGNLWVSLVFLAISGFIVWAGQGANIVMGHRIAPEMTSTVSGILMGFAWAASSFGPTLCAYSADLFPGFSGLASGLLLLTIFPIAAAILSLLLPRSVDG